MGIYYRSTYVTRWPSQIFDDREARTEAEIRAQDFREACEIVGRLDATQLAEALIMPPRTLTAALGVLYDSAQNAPLAPDAAS